MPRCSEPTCNTPFKAARHWQRFCCALCRRTFEVRKTQRAALAYDALMSWRNNRKKSGMSIVTMSQLVRDWTEEDAKMMAEADRLRGAAE